MLFAIWLYEWKNYSNNLKSIKYEGRNQNFIVTILLGANGAVGGFANEPKNRYFSHLGEQVEK